MSQAERRDPYAPYRQVLLPVERVRELSQLRPARVMADTMLCWATIVAAWVVAARWPVWWVVLLVIPVIGSRYYALFILGHDGMHRRLFRSRRMNDWWNDLFCLGPIGAVTHINNRNHLRHHQYLATEADPDRHKHGCFNKADGVELIGFLSGVAGFVRSTRNVFHPVAAAGRADDETEGGYTIRDLLVLGGLQVALIGGLTTAIGWWAWPVLWLVPVYCFTYLADNFRAWADHSFPEADARADTHRLVTYVSHPVERWFLSPMNMNFHAAHHLWPSIPYYNLPAADREIRGRPEAAGMEWRRSYLGYLLRYWLALPLEECRAGRPKVEAIR